MVHVRKCPCELGRSKPSFEFNKFGKPQLYCYGWIDGATEETIECCLNCKDYYMGEQANKDFEDYQKLLKEQGLKGDNCNDDTGSKEA